MYASDILIIENGGQVNITNVNQITVGQLIIRNYTYVTMTPSSGLPRVLSIQGYSGDDFVIESGSGLTITGNDPKLSLYMKNGATAAIYGTLTFSGQIAHNINSQDSLGVRFKNGSFLYQNSIGNVFSNSGAQNSVVFENGSSFVLNNETAASPFGFSAPASKVKFERGSNFVIGAVSGSAFKFGGRVLSNIIVQNGLNINILDSLNTFTCDTLYVPSGSTLKIANIVPNYLPEINFRGNLNINGSLILGDPAGAYHVNLNGTGIQSILGGGNIQFPENGVLVIDNNIQLFRDLVINCSLSQNGGSINSNGFNLTVNGRLNNIANSHGNNQPLPVSKTENNEPKKFSLSQNYPNPFNSQTIIEFELPKDSKVSLNLYDINGRLVSEILNKDLSAGLHNINFDARNISSGIYFYTLNTTDYRKTMKMILVK
jgi:hypothetical protein